MESLRFNFNFQSSWSTKCNIENKSFPEEWNILKTISPALFFWSKNCCLMFLWDTLKSPRKKHVTSPSCKSTLNPFPCVRGTKSSENCSRVYKTDISREAKHSASSTEIDVAWSTSWSRGIAHAGFFFNSLTLSEIDGRTPWRGSPRVNSHSPVDPKPQICRGNSVTVHSWRGVVLLDTGLKPALRSVSLCQNPKCNFQPRRILRWQITGSTLQFWRVKISIYICFVLSF